MSLFPRKEKYLNVHSIFTSINGEVCNMGQGSFTVFIRLAGCNLRCSYCDTRFAQRTDQGKNWELPAVITAVEQQEPRLVTVTGGEPLLQKDALEDLCRELWKRGFYISIETNGSICIPKDWRVSWVVDYKLPYSAANGHMVDPHKQWKKLKYQDFIKMVIYGEDDLRMALQLMENTVTSATFALSPVMGAEGSVPVEDIIKEVQNSGILSKRNVILNCQLHKLLNLQEPN